MPAFRIKELAEAQGLNISRLSYKAEMPYSQLYDVWSNRTQRPALTTLQRIADALGCPVWALYEGAPLPDDQSEYVDS
jgi:transcriptional regulator with XRE-family HTH domain